VPRRRRIPLNDPAITCVQSPIIQPDEAAQEPKRTFVAAPPPPELPPEIGQLRSGELAALQAFFEMLSQWDDALAKGGNKDA